MKGDIIKKLKLVLAESVQKECQTVYILAEIRKLLCVLNIEDDFLVLRFYSNWVLHSEISKTNSIRPLLEEIEETILENEYDPFIVWKMVEFKKFREEISQFLDQRKINNQFRNISYWQNFKRILVNILIDCPLKPQYGNIKEFRFIKGLEKNVVNFRIEFKNHVPIEGHFTSLKHSDIA